MHTLALVAVWIIVGILGIWWIILGFIILRDYLSCKSGEKYHLSQMPREEDLELNLPNWFDNGGKIRLWFGVIFVYPFAQLPGILGELFGLVLLFAFLVFFGLPLLFNGKTRSAA